MDRRQPPPLRHRKVRPPNRSAIFSDREVLSVDSGGRPFLFDPYRSASPLSDPLRLGDDLLVLLTFSEVSPRRATAQKQDQVLGGYLSFAIAVRPFFTSPPPFR